jgi:EmrB/QacA subfamily drug resistance transporter
VALALITTNTMEGPERNRAFGVFAAVSGAGAALGLLLGGMLTSWLSWRWVLFVNVPIGLVIAALVPLFLAESERRPGRFDLGGALTSTVGMTALVYGFIHASEKGWSNTWTIVAFVAAVVLLAAFVLVETRHSQAIVPLRLFASRDRAFSYAIMFAFVGGMMGMFFFLTQFVQNVLGYSPIKAGVAFLPVALIIGVSAQISSQLLAKLGPKPFLILGAALATGGLAWLAQLSASSGYLGGLLGPMLIFGLGMGFIFVPLTLTAVNGVRPEETGAASAMLNVMQQVGGSLGLSILVTVFATASRHEQTSQTKNFLAHATPQQQQLFAQGKLKPPDSVVHAVLAHGISVAFAVAIIFAAVGLLFTLFSRNDTPKLPEGAPIPMG